MSPNDHLLAAVVEALAARPDIAGQLAGLLAPHLVERERPSASEDGWMSSRDAAVYLGLSRAALHRLTSARALPFAQDRPGAKCWFKRSDLDAWRRGETPLDGSGASKLLPTRPEAVACNRRKA